MKQCKSCCETKDDSEFSKDRLVCKKCFSLRVTQKQILIKAENNPERYMSCDNCDRVFSKYRGKAHLTKNVINKACPFCGSAEVLEY